VLERQQLEYFPILKWVWSTSKLSN